MGFSFIHSSILSNWLVRASLNCKAPPCFNRSRLRRFLQSTCLLLCSSGFAPIPPNTTFVCVCLTAQFVFFSRTDSGVLLAAINVQVSASTLSINQSAKNVARNQAAPSSRVSIVSSRRSTQLLQQVPSALENSASRHGLLLSVSLEDDPESWFKSSGIITEWLLLLLVEFDIPTTPGVKWTGDSLRRGGASSEHVVGVSITVIMAWGLWKSLTSALLYIDVSVCPSSEALFFFGHLLSRVNHLEAPGHQQATPSVVRSTIESRPERRFGSVA